MALNFLPSTNYGTQQAAWTAMINAADFWDSVDGNTVTVGGLTLGFNAENNIVTVSGYGLSGTMSISFANNIMIATTDKSLLFKCTITGGGTMGVLMLDRNGNEWGAALVPFSGTSNGWYIAPGATTYDLALKNDNILNATLTQLVPLTGTNCTWIMENAFDVLTSPNPTYAGKMELNGIKYVMAGRAAISYTD